MFHQNLLTNELASHRANELNHYRAIELVRGVSLMEFVIYIALVSIILLVISSAFVSISRSGSRVESKTEVNSSIRFAMNKIVGDVKTASAVSIPTVVNGTASTLQLTVGADTILYDVSSGQLRRKINAGASDVVTASTTVISNPFFTRLENYNTVLQATTTTIRISMSASYNSANQDYQYTVGATTTAALR